jgi:hypothetical protein
VIEIDVTLFEARHAFGLMCTNNPSMLEAFHSPLVYCQVGTWPSAVRQTMWERYDRLALAKSWLSHAKKNFQVSIERKPDAQVMRKKYLHVLRPLFNLEWFERVWCHGHETDRVGAEVWPPCDMFLLKQYYLAEMDVPMLDVSEMVDGKTGRLPLLDEWIRDKLAHFGWIHALASDVPMVPSTSGCRDWQDASTDTSLTPVSARSSVRRGWHDASTDTSLTLVPQRSSNNGSVGNRSVNLLNLKQPPMPLQRSTSTFMTWNQILVEMLECYSS